jgi:hypothetical protein
VQADLLFTLDVGSSSTKTSRPAGTLSLSSSSSDTANGVLKQAGIPKEF